MTITITQFNTIVGVVIALIAVAIVVYLVTIFNGLVQLRQNILKSWANIDVLLKQRFDEIPNLIATVKGYAKHEKDVFEKVTDARTRYLAAQGPGAKAAANDALSGVLKSLFAVAEGYPELKASANFLKLQERVTGLENEISDRREFYNDAVANYNIRIRSFPDLFMALVFGFKHQELFQAVAGERGAVKVDLE